MVRAVEIEEITVPINATATTNATASQASPHRGGRWIDDWRPEDPDFWENGGARVARRNLGWSIFAEHLGFSVWLIWSVSAALLLKAGFTFTPQQLFILVAAPNLVGALIRLPYTLAVPKFGGRNWTIVSALLLLIPTLLFVVAVQRPGTPFWLFVVIASTAGLGGGNFASSMANINFFYPAAKKGSALGLNAAGGNIGVALIQFFLPIIVGGAGVFGLVTASKGGLHLARAGWLYAVLAVAAAGAAYFFMNNLSTASSRPREQFEVLKRKQTWILSLLYIGTFGSFIGYSAAMPLLIKLEFWVPNPTPAGTGINFAYYAFLGALVGSIARPLGGRLADAYGGARVTLGAFVAMIAGTLAVLWTLRQLTPNPGKLASIATDNASWFPWFLGFFLFVFAATGVANGSTYRMVPIVWRHEAERVAAPGTVGHSAALTRATKESSAALGIIGAIGALGGFLIPMTFGAPWIDNPVDAVQNALMLFAGYYILCGFVTWFVYLRRSFLVYRVPSLAEARA
jgi:MFS transporter, NNP family, nitrate/nitrite transporter